MHPYTNIYNDKRFRQGFALIENQGDEKLTIATFLAKKVQGLLKQKKYLNILDLAGGSGSIWSLIEDLLYKMGILADGKIKVSLVDSSEEQIEQAIKLNLSWLNAKKGDATTYLKDSKASFDLITCIHFFPGLPKNKQEEVFKDCQSALGQGGIWVGVQPGKDNPLTLAKKELIKIVANFDYHPNYIKPMDVDVETISSYLRIEQTQLTRLAYFLLGSFAAGKIINPDITRRAFEKIITGQDDRLEIILLNDYLLWRKK